MARLPLVESATAPAPVREALEAMPANATVYQMIAHAETVLRPFLVLAGVIQTELALAPRLRQLAILRVAALTHCEYEQVQHDVIARIEGATAEQVAAVAKGHLSAACLDERESLALRFVDDVVEHHGAGAEITAHMAAAFTDREIIELLIVIWQYLGLALLLNTTALEAQPPLDPQTILDARARRAALE